MGNFDICHQFTARWEGGASNHPDDRGGLTMYGVCTEYMKDFAKQPKNRPLLESLGLAGTVNAQLMRKITPEAAKAIFRAGFWDRLYLDEASLPMALAVYDSAVNCGLGNGVWFGQIAVNQRAGRKVLDEDKLIGPRTRDAFRTADREGAVLCAKRRLLYHQRVVDYNPSQRVFLKGWTNRCNDLIATIKAI